MKRVCPFSSSSRCQRQGGTDLTDRTAVQADSTFQVWGQSTGVTLVQVVPAAITQGTRYGVQKRWNSGCECKRAVG